MGHFVKLSASLLDSTLWFHSHDVLRVWIYLLLKCDSEGEVDATVPAIAHHCLLPIDRVQEILQLLASPDQFSRSGANEGRRIEVVTDPQFKIRVLNYQRYREIDYTRAERQRRYRERQQRPQRNAVTPLRNGVTSLRNAVTPLRVTQVDVDVDVDVETPPNPPYRGGSAATESVAAPAAAQTGLAALFPPGEPLLTFPCRGQVREWIVTTEAVQRLRQMYPALDVEAELRKALAWVLASPGRQKTARGMPRFLVGWLNRASDRQRAGAGTAEQTQTATIEPSEWVRELERAERERRKK